MWCSQSSDASQENDSAFAQYYLESGGDPSLVIFECIIDDSEVLQLWIQKSRLEVAEALNQVDMEGHTLLAAATGKQDYDLVQKLINDGASVNYIGSKLSSNSPVVIAIKKGDMEMLQLLVENGASLTDSKGSLEENSGEILEELNQSLSQDLEDGGDRWEDDIDNLIYAYVDGNALSIAISNRQYEIAEYLIDLGVPYDGKATVSTRIVLGDQQFKIFRTMLEGDPALVNSTALSQAIRTKNIDLINWILSKNVKIESAELLQTTIQGGDQNVIQLVIAHTPPDLLRSAKLLSVSVVAQNIPLIDFFLAQGVPIDEAWGEDQKTALESALGAGGSKPKATNVIQHLIDRGADVNRMGYKGFTPLVSMVQQREPDLINLLLNNGANIDQRDANGDTPLIFAIREGQTDLIQLLVSRGANVNQPNGAGRLPISINPKSRGDDIHDYLVSQGATFNP